MKSEKGEVRSGKRIGRSEEREMKNFRYLFNCCLRVLVVAISICRISLQSLVRPAWSVGVIRPVSFKRSSQYSVSAHSLREIVVFIRNSFLLTAYWASVRFAPIEVPERSNCLARTNSCCSSQRRLYRLYMRMANFRLFSSETLIPILNIRKFKEKSHRKRLNYEA